MGRFRIAVMTALALGTMLVASSTAYGLTLTASHTAPSATYQGWGYLTSGGDATAAGWKWTATGWQAASFPTGTSVWIYPWGSGWNWVYKSSTWYAFKTTQLATWSCSALTDDPYVYSTALRGSIDIKKYNASTSASAGSAGIYDRITMLCGNGFADAAASTTKYAMVKVEKLATCTVFTPDCWLHPTVTSSVTGYVDVSKISDLPTQPGQGTFGEIPA